MSGIIKAGKNAAAIAAVMAARHVKRREKPMKLFQKKTHPELELILQEMRMNAENNYRDATLENLRDLEEQFHLLEQAGKLNEKQQANYSELIEGYKQEFKGFTHREQIAKW